jgi:parvulin-like peptidyl-prolyl isomerase
MTQHIVVSRMRDTSGWDFKSIVMDTARWGWRGILVLLLFLSLAGCEADDDGDPSGSAGEQATVIVATVEPTGEPLAAPTTAVPPTVTPTATPPAPLAALVNGEYVFLADFERRLSDYEQALSGQGLDPESAEGRAHLAQVRQDVLESLIDYVLIEQAATSLGLALSDAELESEVEAAIEDGGGQAAFDEWLQATGQTRDDFKEMLRQSMLSQRVMEVVTGDVPEVAEQIHARHIVVESEEMVQQVLASLREGADFAALVREHSMDVATKENGGDLGWFPRGLVAPELENAAFALQPGEYSEGILLGDGYHIVQVVERDLEHPLTPEMQLHLQQARFGQWLEEQRAAATIERFVGE